MDGNHQKRPEILNTMELRRIVFIFAKIACVLIHKTVAKCPQTDGYPYSVFLDPAHKIHFTWDVDYKRSTVNFRLCVELGSPQWFGVGFSNYGELTWADFVVFWTGKSLSHHFQVGSSSVKSDTVTYRYLFCLFSSSLFFLVFYCFAT